VKDAQGNLVLGRTRWRRFAAVMIPAVAAAGVLVAGVANGWVPASFSVSGSTFKVSADSLSGTGFVQYGGFAFQKGAHTVPGPGGTWLPDSAHPEDLGKLTHPVAVSGIKSATLKNLCQSVTVPSVNSSLVIHAGNSDDPNHQVTATDLLIGMESLTGDATFKNIVIGQDASTLTGGPEGAVGLPGQFGQQAEGVSITGLRQVAWSTSAGTFNLKGLDLHVSFGGTGKPEECF
jgi:hypothetical protein